MSEENKIGYYAVIPSTILFNNDLKPNEKLLYAVITVLSNKEGYCYASNAYLGKLFNVIPHTISIWVSNLKNKGFPYVDIITDEKGEVIQRRIYPNDTPYVINKTGGMFQKGQYNIISNNKIDRFFNYIINNKEEFPAEFSKVDFNEIYYDDPEEYLSIEEKKYQKSLEGTGVSREEYNKLLNKITKIKGEL